MHGHSIMSSITPKFQCTDIVRSQSISLILILFTAHSALNTVVHHFNTALTSTVECHSSNFYWTNKSRFQSLSLKEKLTQGSFRGR